MNPNDFKRDIVSRHVRAIGDAPEIGRIGRMHKTVVTSVEGGRRRSGHSRGQRPPSGSNQNHAWVSLGLGVIALAVVLAAVGLWMIPMARRAKTVAVPQTIEEVSEKPGIRVTSQFSSPTREEAVALVESAVANRDPAQVEKLFRLGSASVTQVTSFCAGLAQSDGELINCQWLSSIDSPHSQLEGVVVNFHTEDFTPHQRLALLTPDAEGRWQVDFEAFARVVKPSWEEILKPGTEPALVRVTLAPDFYYNGPFQDESEWVSYGISSPDLDFPIRGYCRQNSSQAEAVKQLFADGVNAARVTLEIRHVEGGGEKQFEITRVLAQDWMLPIDDAPSESPMGGLKAGF